MTTAQVVGTSVTVTDSSFQNYTHLDDHTRQNTFFLQVSSWVGHFELSRWPSDKAVLVEKLRKKNSPLITAF